MQRVSVLGSTGSIGQSTLDVLARHPKKYRVHALAARQSVDLLFEQCLAFRPVWAAVVDPIAAGKLEVKLQAADSNTQVLQGLAGLKQIAADDDVDTVVAAIVGAAGLEPTLSAVEAGKKVLLANKEALVMSGQLFTDAAKASGACILPVDSEHNAIFQCLPGEQSDLAVAGVSKILLTGSGGPFRTRAPESLHEVSPEEACAHPNWDMGKKISVDSATMMNKGLEFIEACWLFNANPEQIEILLHPQSIVHSMVQYNDGSVLAQLGQPDMRTPIAHCLAWPQRIFSGVEPLDFTQLGHLEFSAPDFTRFPCLRLAIEAARAGGDCPTALNAANEVAVEHFLQGGIRFTDIARVIEKVMTNWTRSEPKSLQAVLKADSEARKAAEIHIQTLHLHANRHTG